ncbi:MAG: c-type cytochrome [Magnetococcales bacterium]|nr:c-type cytochrome [Magnetococcales bacterium]MBF0322333.1 c-type cytochrome [Magnetococcales bacterium]
MGAKLVAKLVAKLAGVLFVTVGLFPLPTQAKTLYQCGNEQGGYELSSEPCKAAPAPSGVVKLPGSAQPQPRKAAPPGVFPQEESEPQTASEPEKKGSPTGKKGEAHAKKSDSAIQKAKELSSSATGLMAAGNNGGAIAALEEAWRLNPKNPIVLLNLGVAHNRNGNWTRARTYYQQAMEFEYRKKAREGVETKITNPHSLNYGKSLIDVVLDSWNRGQPREEVFELKGSPIKGKDLYDSFCANQCHQAHGWGTTQGELPQISGQHAPVLLRQWLDIVKKNRETPSMSRHAQVDAMGGEQAMADVTAYIARLPMTPFHGQGPGTELLMGKNLYHDHCARCHGQTGEGDGPNLVPRIQGQHHAYMARQYGMMRSGQHHALHPLKALQLHDLTDEHIRGILDYVSRFSVDTGLLAPK